MTINREALSILGRVAALLDYTTTVLTKVIKILVTFLGLFITVIITINVILRYQFATGLGWSNELSRYLLIWITMLLVGPLLKDDSHLKVDVLVRRFSLQMRQRIRLVELGLIFILGIFMLVWGWRQVMAFGFLRTAPATGLPMAYFYLSLPTCGFLMMIFSLDKFIQLYNEPSTIDKDYERQYGTQTTSEEDL